MEGTALGHGHKETASKTLPAVSGAEGGIRTHTGERPLRPERSASTSSATSARAVLSGVYFRNKAPRCQVHRKTAVGHARFKGEDRW